METKKNMVCARARARPDQSVTQTKVSVRYALRGNHVSVVLFHGHAFVTFCLVL